jgi:hypothetical protein
VDHSFQLVERQPQVSIPLTSLLGSDKGHGRLVANPADINDM